MLVAQLYPTLCDPMDFNQPDSSVHIKKEKCSAVSDSLRPHGLQLTGLLCPWDFPGKSTGVGCHFLLQGIFPTQGSNPGLLHCRQILYHLSHQGNPSVHSRWQRTLETPFQLNPIIINKFRDGSIWVKWILILRVYNSFGWGKNLRRQHFIVDTVLTRH